MRFSSHLSAFSLLNIYGSLAFPSYGTLAGLSRSELDAILPTLKRGVLESPPGPLQDTSAKLVNDEKHPWKPAGKHDIRGPCPGLNTLASHGVGLPTAGLNKRGSSDVDFCFQQWLPRNGVATPGQIVNAVQEGSLLMSIYYPVADVSILPILLLPVQVSTWETTSPYSLLYAAHLVDGNLVTNLLSIGGKTGKTGPDPPSPAIVGGLNTHAVFEGDASTTRGMS
jgi:hypothetical protein